MFIRSQEKLIVDVIGGQQSWIEEQFDISAKIFAIKLDVEPKDNNFDFKIRISHPSSDQTEDIVVKYIADESSQHAEEKAEDEEERYQDMKHETREGESWIMDTIMEWHWTDYIILIMAALFLIILFGQKCLGSEGKYHVL